MIFLFLTVVRNEELVAGPATHRPAPTPLDEFSYHFYYSARTGLVRWFRSPSVGDLMWSGLSIRLPFRDDWAVDSGLGDFWGSGYHAIKVRFVKIRYRRRGACQTDNHEIIISVRTVVSGHFVML